MASLEKFLRLSATTLTVRGRSGAPPTPPLNLVGDFGGGGMLLAFGVCAALLSRANSGLGQVVDAAMIDGQWDELKTLAEIESEIDRQVASCASILGLPDRQIFPV